MKHKFFFTSLMVAGFAAAAIAQDNVVASVQPVIYSGSELQTHVRQAHTQEEYLALATSYAAQANSYQHKAADEKLEWERRSQNVSGPLAKAPRAVDSAKNLYEYYASQADAKGALADHYRQLEVSAKLAEAKPAEAN